MLDGGGSHLLVPYVGCPRSVKGSIPVAPLDTSNDHKSTYLHLIIT